MFECFILLEFVEGTARITEARLSRERSEGKIIDFQRIRDSGYKVVSKISLSSRENKVRCCNTVIL